MDGRRVKAHGLGRAQARPERAVRLLRPCIGGDRAGAWSCPPASIRLHNALQSLGGLVERLRSGSHLG